MLPLLYGANYSMPGQIVHACRAILYKTAGLPVDGKGEDTMAEYIQVITTTATEDDARKVAHALVEARLAGCVQIVGPIGSTYWWEGRIEEAEEWLCLAKSRADLFDALEAAIREAHPYDVPEVLAVPVAAGSQGYLDWLGGELRP